MWAWGPQPCPQRCASAALTRSHNTPASAPSACKAGDFNQVWPKYSCCTLPALWATQTRCPWAMGFRWPVWAQRLEGNGKQLREEGLLAEPKRWGCWEPSWCPLPTAPVLLLLLSWAASGTRPGLLLYGCFGTWLLSGGRKAFKAASVPVPNTLWAVSALVLLLLWYPRSIFFFSCCSLQEHTNPLIAPL